MSNIRTDIAGRLRDGRQLARTAYQAVDVEKRGILRAGNSGIQFTDGDFAASCPRIAHLRQLGIEVEIPDDSTLIMFQVGTANEQLVYDDLVHTSVPGEVILRETEIPIEWFTSNGTKVTGRPDMVICINKPDVEGTAKPVPVTGLELKSVASVWTTRSVLIEGEPKLAHLAQAGHYSWKLGRIPFKLIYKQYAIQSIPMFGMKYFPKEGQPGSEHCEYDPKGQPKSVRPFEVVYDLEFNGTTLEGETMLRFRLEGTTQWTDTVVTIESIERYYEFISRMPETGNLGTVPLTMNYLGEEKGYSNCNYCPLAKVCGTHSKAGDGVGAYEQWLLRVQQHLAENKSVPTID